MANHGEICWPPVGNSDGTYGKISMAAVTGGDQRCVELLLILGVLDGAFARRPRVSCHARAGARPANVKRGEQMDPVVHFELPADDRERMAAFYGSAFGWHTELLGPEMGSYTVVTTTESDGSRPTTPGAINGGFFLRTSDPASHAPSVVIAVQDIHASLSAVEAAGGTVAGPTQEIPGVGLYGSFHDSEGNRLSVLQPLPPGTAQAS